MHGSATTRELVGPFAYLRFHGSHGYSGAYPDDVLRSWAQWCTARRRDGISVYAYFNNDVGGHAPRDAVRLRAFCQQAEEAASSR
jgi:uncharacterized protein YecE (DUF72 family)